MFIIASFLGACNSLDSKRFERIDGERSGFTFYNEVVEDSVFNALDFTNLYTGSGVGIGDINNDGLPDIFMGGCMSSSKLFLNKGNLKFEDISIESGTQTTQWITGVAMVDINQDDWLDIYLSVSGPLGSNRKNLLFVNQKNNQFIEEAAKYGIADSAQCTHSSFFDFDKDGDLDLYLAVNPTDYTIFNVNTIRKKKTNGEAASTDKLYRNEGNGTFVDISHDAGILIEGYSLGLNVSDINGDHWPDVYVTNDFLSNDILYINQQDGTFKNEAASYMKHTSFASMGIDIADINNDALPDIYVLDMFPEDNYRQKMLMPGTDYNRFEYIIKAGYEPQYSRNTLQINNGNQRFSEVGQLAQLHKTDWSWSALLADFDNDGWRDVFVANGFLRDMGDLDYINFNKSQPFGSKAVVRQRQLEQIKNQKSIKIPNYMFQNHGNLSFSQQMSSWGFEDSTCSNGAAYADLDLDGDLDLVVNNLNQASFLYENHSRELDKHHFFKLRLKGQAPNRNAIGSKVWLYSGDKHLYHEYLPYRGYESSMDPVLHMGLGSQNHIDSLVILWPDLTRTVRKQLSVDSLYEISYDTPQPVLENTSQLSPIPIFSPDTSFAFAHQEDYHVDFYYQTLLPHQFNQFGPALAVADINGDALQDVFVGGAAGFPSMLFLQQKNGSFQQLPFTEDKAYEDVDALFLDVDLDGDQDLYVVSGGSVSSTKTDIYQDRIYLNDGVGKFVRHKEGLPEMQVSTSCVRASDYDKDGDIDLFVGGRVVPGKYPEIPRSFLLENTGTSFREVSQQVLPKGNQLGMVTDATWVDIDQDGDQDLIVVGEWMPVRVYQNTDNQLIEMNPKGLEFSSGWWNAIETGDFDQDGDMDFLLGNLGLNTNYRASQEYPLCIYAKDFDKNGSVDPIMCQFIKGVEYPIASRDKLIQQIPFLESSFSNYRSYAMAKFQDVFPKSSLRDAQVLKSYILESSYMENLGAGNFALKPLPVSLQYAPINDILVEDINGDGYQDALLVGNSHATDVKIGRYDAFTGAYLQGRGNGEFDMYQGAESGFLADKDARRIANLTYGESLQKKLFLVANNSDSLQLFTKHSYHKLN